MKSLLMLTVILLPVCEAFSQQIGRWNTARESAFNFSLATVDYFNPPLAIIAETGTSIRFTLICAGILSFLVLLLAVVMLLRHAAAQRRAEQALAEEHELLSRIIDTMPESVFVKDFEGRYVIDNAAHRRFLGAKSLGEVEGKTVFDFFDRADAEKFEVDDRQVMETGEPIFDREEAFTGRDGRLTWLSTTKVPLRDRDGKFTKLLCVSGDISLRKQAEEKMRLATEQLQRSNRELEEFASVASHDLQEPLRKIQAFGDRLKTKCGPTIGPMGRDYLERMQDAASRMQILIQDLLTLSRVTSKAQPFVPLELGRIVREVVSDLEMRIEQTKAKLHIGPLPDIEADPLQMRQLFQNLIANALKFQRPDMPPEVTISAKTYVAAERKIPRADAGDEVCEITVQDNGIGFDQKYADKIFQVFQRLHSRSEYEGTGIGLAVCRKIAERHGGTIQAQSAEGQGATFLVTLPVKQSMRNNRNEDAR